MSIVNQHTQYEFPVDLTRFPESDGVPLETAWHWWAMYVLVESTHYFLRGRRDFACGGNQFIYWDENDPKKVVGPDYFLVFGARDVPVEARPMWCVWVEGGLFPNVIIELLSAKTARADRTTKKKLYEQTFKTNEYFLYDHRTRKLDGFRLVDEAYVRVEPNERGWLWSGQLKLWIGTWEGEIEGPGRAVWLRFYDEQGRLVDTMKEAETRRVEQARKRLTKERHRAKQERQRAQAAEAEIARLKAQLKKQQRANGTNGANRRSKR